MLYHPLLMQELVRQRQEDLLAAARRRRAVASSRRPRRRGRARTAVGWALVEAGLRLVTSGAEGGRTGISGPRALGCEGGGGDARTC